MKINIQDFIGIFENAIEDDWCDKVINWYNYMENYNPNLILNRQSFDGSHPGFKRNNFIFLEKYIEDSSIKNLYDYFINVLNNKVFFEYKKKYFVLDSDEFAPETVKIQKTTFEEGYHIWHYEHNINNPNRVLVYMVYLNDVYEGGETEFLYQRKRIQPKKGTILLFPPNFTHTHRGNPPLSNEKYAITGWICF